MKRVAMFVTNPCTHDARVMKEAKTLASHGYQVKIYALGNSEEQEGLHESEDNYEIETIVIHWLLSFKNRLTEKNNHAISSNTVVSSSIKFKYRLKSFFLIFYKLCLNHFFRKRASNLALNWNADILHCHDLNTMAIAKTIKPIRQVKVIYDSHELWIHRNRGERNSKLEVVIDKLCEKKLIAYANRVITVSPSIVQWLSNQYSFINKPTLIRNIPQDLTNKKSKFNKTLKERLELKDDDYLIIYTGKFTSGRGILKTLKSLRNHKNIYFALLGYGDDKYLNSIKKEAQRYNLENQIIILEAVDYTLVSSFIEGADLALVYIEPICLSYRFALPNKLFEAIHANVPILASNLPDISNIVNNYQIGICFDSYNLNEILKNLTTEQINIWRKNLLLAKSELKWKHEGEKLLKLYESL